MVTARKRIACATAALLLSLVACRTPQVALPDRFDDPVEVLTPAEALARAQSVKDDAFAAELAWAHANDRAYARERLDRGLTTAPYKAPLLLRRALLNKAELRGGEAIDDLLTLIQHVPGTAEAEVALVLLHDWLPEHWDKRETIRTALEASGLLAPGAPSSAARVTLGTAIANRLARHAALEDASTDAVLTRGGWLTKFRAIGPIAPVDDEAFARPNRYEASSNWKAPVSFRGSPRTAFSVLAEGRALLPALYGPAGVYVMETAFVVDELAASGPLVLEAHLPTSARVSIDGTVVVERRLDQVRGKKLHRMPLRLSPGAHRLTITLLASSSTRPSISILSPDGQPVISGEMEEAKDVAGGRVSVGNDVLSVADDPSALGLVRRLTADAERALFGRMLGSMIAISDWYSDPDLAQALLFGTLEAAPQAAVVHASWASLILWSRLPSGLAQAAMEAALEFDATQPAVLVGLARVIQRDTPDRALELADRATAAAPDAHEPRLLRHRVLLMRSRPSEAAAALLAAVERGAPTKTLEEGAAFLRSRDRIAEAIALETEAETRAGARRPDETAARQLRAGQADAAIATLSKAAKGAAAAPRWTRVADLELARGQAEAAIRAAATALSRDPDSAQALEIMLIAQAILQDRAGLAKTLARMRKVGSTRVTTEAIAAEALGRPFAEPAEGSWLAQMLEFDPTENVKFLPGTTTPQGLDPADRWSRHKSVNLLDRVVDWVRPNGDSLSVRHAVTRLQTKEATDQAGELDLPNDALPLALRTIKPDGRTIDVDRHAGKQDLSFSGLAPGDAVERRWVSLDGAATPWGGYLRRFYFRNTTPVLRAELVVVVPKGTAVWTHSYHGAPEPVITDEGEETIYYFRASETPALDPEPNAVPHDEYLPFVVVAVGFGQKEARATNLLFGARSTQTSFAVTQAARQVAGKIKHPKRRVRELFDWVTREISQGNQKNPTTTLATRRGSRSGLFVAMLRASGIEAELLRARDGTAAEVAPLFPDPRHFDDEVVRIVLADGGVLWAELATNHPWLGKLMPSRRGGSLLVRDDQSALSVQTIAPQDVEVWPLGSTVDLEVNEAGTARGTMRLSLPGTFGADIRNFIRGTRREDVERQMQAWVASVLQGARLQRLDTENLEDPLLPLGLVAEIEIPMFMVREGEHLIAEQFFGAPLVQRSLGLPTLAAYIRVPERTTPLLIVELRERMEVTVRMPEGAGVPVEMPKSFERLLPYGHFIQELSWDPQTRTARMVREESMPSLKVLPRDFPLFREAAQELLQMTRNRLIVPLGKVQRVDRRAIVPQTARAHAPVLERSPCPEASCPAASSL